MRSNSRGSWPQPLSLNIVQVEPKHIFQVGSIFGDQSLPIFAALLSRAVYFMVCILLYLYVMFMVTSILTLSGRKSRQTRHPRNSEQNHSSTECVAPLCPYASLALSSEQKWYIRWELRTISTKSLWTVTKYIVKSANAKKQNPTIRPPEKRKAVKLTSREVSSLTDSNATATSFGGPNQSIQLWRCAVLLLLDCRAQYLISTCKEVSNAATIKQTINWLQLSIRIKL